MCCDSPTPPDPNPGMIQNAEAARDVARIQQQTALEYLDFSKQQYATNTDFVNTILDLQRSIANKQMDIYDQEMAIADRQSALGELVTEQQLGIGEKQLGLMDQQMQIADENAERARDYYNYETTTFRPIEQQLVQEAKDFNTEAKREQLASQAMADINTAYSQQRQAALDTLARYGVNPNSNRFAALNMALSQGQAADAAGAANRARTTAEEMGRARMYDAAALGRNIASNTTAAYGLTTAAGGTAISAGNAASGAGGAALGSAGAGLGALGQAGSSAGRAYDMFGGMTNTFMAPGAQMGSAYGQFGNMLGGATQSYGTAGNIYGQEFNARMQGFNAAQNSDSGFGSLLGFGARILAAPATGSGSIAGSLLGFADGGKVHKGKGAVSGPGGPVDDKIPAMLSDGEYVLPADTVQRIGKKKLDKLVAETHTPAAVQRRQAIKRSA